MAYNNTAAYQTRGTRFRVDGLTIPGVREIQGLGSASNSEIDTTTLKSTANEFELGLPDSGSITISGIHAPQHPTTAFIDTANREGSRLNVSIVVGGVPTGDNETDGTGVELKDDVAVSGAVSNGLLVFDVAERVTPAITEGDYVVTSNGSHRINGIVKAGTNIKVSTDSTAADAASVADFIRPAFEWTFTALVSQFERNLATNDVVMFSLQLRITGNITRTLGTPNVTL